MTTAKEFLGNLQAFLEEDLIDGLKRRDARRQRAQFMNVLRQKCEKCLRNGVMTNQERTMRELKFRAMSLEGELVEFDIFEIGAYYPGDRVFYVYESPCKSRTIEQYTGLKDKNGKEIYGGDIVKWGNCPEGDWGWERPVRIAVVEFDPDIQFNSKNVDHIFTYGRFAYQNTEKYLTVIGNIHQNPELLEAQDAEN